MATATPTSTDFVHGTHWLCLAVDKACFDAVLEWVFNRVHRTQGATVMLDPKTQVIFVKGVPLSQLVKHAPSVSWTKNVLARPFDSVRTFALYTEEGRLPKSACRGAALRRHEELLHRSLGNLLDKLQCTQDAISRLPVIDVD